jgi:hypothetical protein
MLTVGSSPQIPHERDRTRSKRPLIPSLACQVIESPAKQARISPRSLSDSGMVKGRLTVPLFRKCRATLRAPRQASLGDQLLLRWFLALLHGGKSLFFGRLCLKPLVEFLMTGDSVALRFAAEAVDDKTA